MTSATEVASPADVFPYACRSPRGSLGGTELNTSQSALLRPLSLLRPNCDSYGGGATYCRSASALGAGTKRVNGVFTAHYA